MLLSTASFDTNGISQRLNGVTPSSCNFGIQDASMFSPSASTYMNRVNDSSSSSNSSNNGLDEMLQPQQKQSPKGCETSTEIREKLLVALRALIPHKSTLTLRLLVSYAVDDGVSDVIVIDETLHRSSTPRNNAERDRSPLRATTSKPASTSVLDLSWRQETPPPRQPPSPASHIKPGSTVLPQLPNSELLTHNDFLAFASGLLGAQVNKPTRFAVDSSLLNLLPFLQERAPTLTTQPIVENNNATLNNSETLLMLQTLLNPTASRGVPQLNPFILAQPPSFHKPQSTPTTMTLPAPFNACPEFSVHLPTTQVITSSPTISSNIHGILSSSGHSPPLQRFGANCVAPNVTITNTVDFLNSHLRLASSSNSETSPGSMTDANESGGESTFDAMNAKLAQAASAAANNTPAAAITTPTTTTTSNSSLNRRFMNPRRFACNQCRQQFPSLAELNRHTMELHNSFRCTVCKAKFTQRSNLQRHSLKHIGFKPFICKICEKEYYRKDHLVRHIEVTHPNVEPRANIIVRMSSSECLEFLDTLPSGSEASPITTPGDNLGKHSPSRPEEAEGSTLVGTPSPNLSGLSLEPNVDQSMSEMFTSLAMPVKKTQQMHQDSVVREETTVNASMDAPVQTPPPADERGAISTLTVIPE